jgi:outer membrane protein assembly factor BamB
MLFKVFPLCDPDGTAGGAVRFNAHGFDLNRNWDLDDSAKMPEIAAQRRAIENWVDSGHKLDLFLSLHNTETGEYLEAPPGDNPAHWSLAERFFAALGQVSTFAPTRKLFRAEATTTAGKPGQMTVSQGLYHRRKLPAFIMEQMIASNPRLGRLPTVEDRMRFGEGLAQAVALAVREPVVAWPQFRGPGAGGVGTGSPPVEWDGASGKNVVWKTPIPGLGYSSPVVWGDRVFLSSAVSDNDSAVKLGLYGDIQPVQNEGPQRFVVLCLDRKSGKVLWQRTAASGVARVKRHPKSSHANPTPATDGKRLVVSFGSEGLYAFDLDGKQLWKKDLGLLDAGYFRVPAAQWGYASSPVLHDGVVVVQADVQKDSFLAAFHADTGKELWRTPRADVPTFGSPAVLPHAGGGAQVVVNGWKHIGGYDFKTGRELWKMEGTGDIPVPTPVFGSDRIVVTSAHGGGRPVYALRTDGSVAWSRDRLGNYMQTPLLLDGIGYFCYDNGVLTALQLSTGEQLYQQRLGGGTTGFTSSAVAADGRLYITSEDGRTHVVAAGGAFKLLGTNELGEPVMASAAIVDGVLLLRGQRHLFAIGRR